MSCGQCVGIETTFNAQRASKEVRRLRKRGPRRTTRMLIEALTARDIEGATVIDVGGGVGAIQLALLSSGAARVISVDASSAYLNAAREMAREQGVRSRISYVHGNFTEVVDRLDDAEVVTLDRVICCYDDMPGLVDASARRARRLYGLVYPRDRWWTRRFIDASNAFLRLAKNPMRTFLHAPEEVASRLAAHGFDRVFSNHSAFWNVEVWARG